MDLSGLMPILNLLQGTLNKNPPSAQNSNLSSAEPILHEKKDLVKQTTSLYPTPYQPTATFKTNSQKRAEAEYINNNPAKETSGGSNNMFGNFDLNAILPLLSNLGSGVNVGDVSKVMSGLGGGNNMSGLVNIFSNLAGANKKPQNNSTTQTKSLFSGQKIDLKKYKKDI